MDTDTSQILIIGCIIAVLGLSMSYGCSVNSMAVASVEIAASCQPADELDILNAETNSRIRLKNAGVNTPE